MKHAFTGRWRVRLLVSAAAIACSAITLLTGAVPAGAAQQSRPQGKTVAVSYKTVPVSAFGTNKRAAAAVSALCAPGLNEYNRTQACWGVTITFTFLQNGSPVGTLVVGMVQYMPLNANGRTWTEHDTVVEAVPAGETAPVDVKLVASCGSPCHASAHLTGVIRVGLTGTVNYTDDIGTGRDHITNTHYVLDYDAPPFIPLTTVAWNSPIKYRCDNNLAGIAGPGCVFYEFTPTFIVSRAQYGAAAAFIQWAQQNMSAHWGLRGRGKPLTRLAGTAAASKNRAVICGRAWRPFGPWVADGGKVRVSDSCDEYPFAATNQSGGGSVPNGAACAQLEAVKTNDKGGTPAKIWTTVKPIGNPNHNAKCVRGHIPLTLNTAVGRDAYKAFIKAQRLLNNDPFWLAVL